MSHGSDPLDDGQQPRCPACGVLMRDVPGGVQCPACKQLQLVVERVPRQVFGGPSLPGV